MKNLVSEAVGLDNKLKSYQEKYERDPETWVFAKEYLAKAAVLKKELEAREKAELKNFSADFRATIFAPSGPKELRGRHGKSYVESLAAYANILSVPIANMQKLIGNVVDASKALIKDSAAEQPAKRTRK